MPHFFLFLFFKRIYLKSGRRNHYVVSILVKVKSEYKCMDHFRKRDFWTSHLVINKINGSPQYFLISVLYFLYLHQKRTVTIQFCDNILGYDNHSLSVLMSSQVGFPEVEGYQAMNNKETCHNHILCKLHSERKESSDCHCIIFSFHLLQKSVSWYSIVLMKKAWMPLPFKFITDWTKVFPTFVFPKISWIKNICCS